MREGCEGSSVHRGYDKERRRGPEESFGGDTESERRHRVPQEVPAQWGDGPRHFQVESPCGYVRGSSP